MLALADNSIMKKCKKCDETKVCHTEKKFLTWFNTKYECLDEQPNSFWLGQILHCVQDSYSKAHTYRDPIKPSVIKKQYDPKEDDDNDKIIFPDDVNLDIDEDNFNDEIEIENSKPRQNDDENIFSKKVISIIESMIKMNKDNDNVLTINYLLSQVNNNTKLMKFINQNKEDIEHMLILYLFFSIQNERLDKYKNPSQDKLTHIDSDTIEKVEPNQTIQNPKIHNFKFVKYQQIYKHKFYHLWNDTKYVNKEYEHIIIDRCKNILDIYKKHLIDQEKSISIKIKEMSYYISKSVFPLKEDEMNKHSASDQVDKI